MRTTRRGFLATVGLGAAAAALTPVKAEAATPTDAIAQARADGFNDGYVQATLRAESRQAYRPRIRMDNIDEWHPDDLFTVQTTARYTRSGWPTDA